MDTLLVSGKDASLSNFEEWLEENGVRIVRVASGRTALEYISDKNFELVIADEKIKDMTGLELVGKVIAKQPMMNFAVISGLTPEDFHEASEGLGVLMQLPIMPDRTHAKILLKKLKSILRQTK